MKIKRRLIGLVLVFSFVAGAMFSPIYAGPDIEFSELLGERDNKLPQQAAIKKKTVISDFTDVKQSDWFYRYLDSLVQKGTINGKTETTFEPQSSFSYAECSAVIVRYLGLEKEAEKRHKEIVSRLPEMKNQWYVGYFEVLSDLGIFKNYGLYETADKKIVSVNKTAANSPVVRYRFAESISRSFELKSDLKAKNVFSEMGGQGREFIVGGAYKRDVLEKYKSVISDYDKIPEASREYVLKAYYNGIFNGDESGRFNPNNNLTRAEMAKVLATVLDYSLRTRLLNDGYGMKVTENMTHTDAFGEKTLKFDIWTELLQKEAESIEMVGGYIKYTASKNAPEGYAIDAYVYIKNGAVYEKVYECGLVNGLEGFSYYSSDARVLLVLRNVSNGSRPEGVVTVTVSGGNIVEIKPNIREK